MTDEVRAARLALAERIEQTLWGVFGHGLTAKERDMILLRGTLDPVATGYQTSQWAHDAQTVQRLLKGG